jgi:deazaflavin-dependent oxidoreductase (nitroreductase family)
MKVPEPLFKLINLVVVLLLKSPIHRFWSDSLVVVGFTGRKTGRSYKTPVRYVRKGNVVQCFTSKGGGWWRNIAASGEAVLLLGGNQATFKADVVTNEPTRIRQALLDCLDLYPQDAVYHDIRMDPDRKPINEDVERELSNVVLIEFTSKGD